MKKYIVDFNDLKGKEVKCYYTLAILGLIAFCFSNAYLNPNMVDAPIYRWAILLYTFCIEVLSVIVESIILAVTVKVFLSSSKFKNVFFGLFGCFLLLNSVFGVVRLALSAIKTDVLNLTYITILLHMLIKSFLYLSSIKKSFGNIGRKAGVAGVVLIAIDHLIMIFA